MPMHLHMLRSGSSGNSALLIANGTRLLIDAGIGPRVLAKELEVLGLAVRDLDGVIFTHCHSDHLRAPTVGLFAREGVPIYLNPGTWDEARRRLGPAQLNTLESRLVRHFETGAPFAIGGLNLSAFGVHHGQPGPDNPAGDPVGFVIRDERDTFGYCTDIGHVTPQVLDALAPADLLVFECNHDIEMVRMSSRPWHTKQWITSEAGHLSNGQAAAALARLMHDREGRGVVLAHLSEQCNTQGLARHTVTEAFADTCDVTIAIAARHHASVPWVLDRGRARQAPEAAYGPMFAGLFEGL